MLGDSGVADLARSRKRKAQRDTFDIANEFTSLLSPSALLRSGQLFEVEDRRLFSPLSVEPMPKTRRRFSFVKATPKVRPFVKVRGFSFHAAPQVILCVRRKMRREVIHAKGVAGGRVSRRRRRNSSSSVRC